MISLTKMELLTVRDALVSAKEEDDYDVEAIDDALFIVEEALNREEDNKWRELE